MSSSRRRKGRQEAEGRSEGRAKLLRQVRRRFSEHAAQAARAAPRKRT